MEERSGEYLGFFSPPIYEDPYVEEIEIDVGSIPDSYADLTEMLFEECPYVPVRYLKRTCRDFLARDLLLSIVFALFTLPLLIRLFTLFRKIFLEIEETNQKE